MLGSPSVAIGKVEVGLNLIAKILAALHQFGHVDVQLAAPQGDLVDVDVAPVRSRSALVCPPFELNFKSHVFYLHLGDWKFQVIFHVSSF